MTPAQYARLRQLVADLSTLLAEVAPDPDPAEPCFTDGAGCFTGDQPAPLPSEPRAPAQGVLWETPRAPLRRSAVHGWGILTDAEHPHPLRPTETVRVRVQTCRHCCAHRRIGNTGPRLGARYTYQESGGDTWGDVLPPCVVKG